jgi:hypothetical protein
LSLKVKEHIIANCWSKMKIPMLMHMAGKNNPGDGILQAEVGGGARVDPKPGTPKARLYGSGFSS